MLARSVSLSQKHRRTADLSRFRRRRLAHRSARTARARIRERNQRRSRCDLQNSNRLTVQRPRRSQTVARSNGNKYSAAKTAANQRELREKNGRHRRGPPPRGTAQLAQGPPHRLRGAAEEQGRRLDGPAELGRRHPGQEGHDVGGLRVQSDHGVQQRLPRHRTNRQVRVAAGPVPVSAFTRRRRRDASSTPSPRRLLEISHTQARSSGT